MWHESILFAACQLGLYQMLLLDGRSSPCPVVRQRFGQIGHSMSDLDNVVCLASLGTCACQLLLLNACVLFRAPFLPLSYVG